MSITFGVETYDPALLVLKSKGYTVRLEAVEDRFAEWHAQKGDDEVVATNPVELLGLVALWEARGDDWERRSDEPSIYEELVESRIL